jgi:hypothetical protein
MSKWYRVFYQPRPDALLWRRSVLPTTALYFLNSCADWLHGEPDDGPSVEQIGANTFRTSHANLVIRQDLPEALAKAINDRNRRLVYLIDDHVGACASDAGLPENYRRRLSERWQKVFLPLLRRADAIVVCSDYLLHHLRSYAPTVRADPVWDVRLLRDLERKMSVSVMADEVHVAVLGTASHQAGLGFLVPILSSLLARRSDVRLTLPAATNWPDVLAQAPRVSLRWPVPWAEYEERLAHERYDLCLYPSLDSPFAAARSRNKLTEQAITGACGVFSASWPHAPDVVSSGAGTLACNDETAWGEAILAAIEGLQAWRANAAGPAAAIRALNDPGPQKAMWRQLLGKAPDV